MDFIVILLLVFSGTLHAATSNPDPEAVFDKTIWTASLERNTGYTGPQEYRIWAVDMMGNTGPADFGNKNVTGPETGIQHALRGTPAGTPDPPTRLSFFYLLGTAIIIALFVEILSKKDI